MIPTTKTRRTLRALGLARMPEEERSESDKRTTADVLAEAFAMDVAAIHRFRDSAIYGRWRCCCGACNARRKRDKRMLALG